MGNTKKSAVGHVEVWRLFDGENRTKNRDFVARIAGFSIPEMLLSSDYKIDSFGLGNGFSKDRHSRL